MEIPPLPPFVLRLTYDPKLVPTGGSSVVGSFAAPVADCGTKELAGHGYHHKQLVCAGLVVDGAQAAERGGRLPSEPLRCLNKSSFPAPQATRTCRSRPPRSQTTTNRAFPRAPPKSALARRSGTSSLLYSPIAQPAAQIAQRTRFCGCIFNCDAILARVRGILPDAGAGAVYSADAGLLPPPTGPRTSPSGSAGASRSVPAPRRRARRRRRTCANFRSSQGPSSALRPQTARAAALRLDAQFNVNDFVSPG